MSTDPTPSPRGVAVVVRTKNRPVLLRRALASIAAQTHDDVAVVVVNDGGDREPVDALLAELPDDVRARVEVVHHEASVGRAAALNAGLAASAAPFVAVHDDDDSWNPEFLARAVAHLVDDADDMGVAARTEVVFEHIDGAQVVEDRREILAADNHAITLFDMIRRDYAPPISLVYRRAVHEVTGLYDEALPVLEDWDFMLRLVSRYRVGFLDGPPLAFWHQRPQASGDDGNSVAAETGEHERWDLTVRDAWLRRDVENGAGLGPLLHLAEVLDRDRRLAGDRAGALGDSVSALHLQVDSLSRRVGELGDQLQRQSAMVERLLEESKHAALRDDRAAELLTRTVDRLAALDASVHHLRSSSLRLLGSYARRALRRS